MNGAFSFDNPWVLWGFGIFVPMFLFDLFSFGFRREGKLPLDLRRRLFASALFFKVFIACFIIALAGPRWGIVQGTGEYRRGLDVVFAIDVSRSMEIEDVPAFSGGTGEISRLERGLALVRQSAAAVPGARFAAAVSRGRGLVAVPLTWDNEAFFNFLEALDGSSLTGWGTNLESLLDAARDCFQSSFPSRRMILLVSDGEALSGSLRAAADRCAGDSITVSALALGSDEGRPVPQAEGGEQSSAGPVLLSRRDSALMRMAAERSGGLYIDGNRENAARVLAAHLRSLAPESGSGGGSGEKKQRWSLFVIAALLAYAASKLSLLEFQGIRFLFPLLILFVFVSCSRISGKLLVVEANFLHSQGRYNEALSSYLKALDYEDAAPYAEYGLGLVYYSLDEGKAALERFADSREMLESLPEASHRELLYRNYYNSGLAFFGEGDFFAAAAAFREALRADPARLEAKRNLELSLLSLAAENRARPALEQGSEESRARDVLFDYLRQKEQSRWQSREWPPEEQNTGPDY